jgi:cation:H+ antiporter
MTALLYFFALVALWLSAKAVVYATEELARFVSIPPFILSFVLLGIMTSTPEIGLLVNASVANADEIYVGNLMGGIFTLFGLIIPLLVILRHKLSVQVEVKSGIMAEILLLLSYPIVTTLDGKLYWYEGVLCILSYVALVVYFLKKQHLFLKVNSKGFVQNKMLILVTLIGVGLYVLLYASKILVGAILDLSHSMNISPYVFSFLFSPLATNLPEISIIFQSLRSKKVEVALGDYLGSASANVRR